MIIGEIDIPDPLLEAQEEGTLVIFVGAGDYPAVFRLIFHKGKCRFNDNGPAFINGQIREKGSHFLLSHVGGVGFVVEQDEPFDPLIIRRNRPGSVITSAHHPSYLVKEPGPGSILRICIISLSQVVYNIVV